MMFAKRTSQAHSWAPRYGAAHETLEPARRLRRLAPHRRLITREPFLCRRCHANFTLHGICDECRHSAHPGAAVWLSLLGDRGSHTLLDTPGRADPLGFVDGRPYSEQVDRARAATGANEAVTAGSIRINRCDAVVIVFDFNFLGGSLGIAAGEAVVGAIERAVEERKPVVMIVASSGARMQEGLASLFQMARASAAVVRLRQGGLPLIAVLSHPTTGAPYASCASLADVVLAEPNALIGFAGPRVVGAVTGKLREGRRAEELFELGIVDAVVPRQELRRELSLLLRLLAPRQSPRRLGVEPKLPPPPPAAGDRWALLQSIREPQWPTGVRWLELLSDRRFDLRGDRTGKDDPALRCVVAELAGRPIMVLAQDRLAGSGLITAAGYRKALRALRVAQRLHLPVLSIIDTPGAAVGPDADREGIAPWIAECFATLLELPVPVISLVVGQGSSGGALALSVADRIYMLERSVFTVIAPEGAAAIFSKTPHPAAEWAEKLRLTASDAYELGLIDGVVPGAELGRRSRAAQIRRVRELLLDVIAQLEVGEPEALVAARLERYLRSTTHLLESA